MISLQFLIFVELDCDVYSLAEQKISLGDD
jgi:hypothetical protein